MKARPRKRVLLVVSEYHFIAALKGTFTPVSSTRTTTQMLVSATDTTSGGDTRREDDIAVLARFVWRASERGRLVADTLKDHGAELREDH